MNVNLMPYLIVWVSLAVLVIALIVYHRIIAGQEDAELQFGMKVAGLGDDPALVAVAQHQTALERKIQVVDKWGKILTAVAVVYGLGILVFYIYQTWQKMSNYSG